MRKTLIIIILLLCAGSIQAGTYVRGIICDGCGKEVMSERAADKVKNGAVYVFNHVAGRVWRFEVKTWKLGTWPYTVQRESVAAKVPDDIKAAFALYLADGEALEDEAIFVMPPGFPVRSVAGALVDPTWSSTHIEDQLAGMADFRQFETSLSTIISYLLRDGLPMVDLKGMLKTIKITVKFPDGSTQDYEIAFSTDAVSGEARLELEPAGNARMADGQPVPHHALGFAGKTFHDQGGSLKEWIQWASMNGLTVTGGLLGTRMRCSISGSEIRCTVSPL